MYRVFAENSYKTYKSKLERINKKMAEYENIGKRI